MFTLKRLWIVAAAACVAALVATGCTKKAEETPKPSTGTPTLAGKIAGQAKGAVGKVESARAKQSQVGDEE